MSIAGALPVDSNGRRFNGWGSGSSYYLGYGFRIGSTDAAAPGVVLVDINGNALIVASDLDSGAGTANRMGVALLVPASGGPAVVPGDATNGLKVQTADGAQITIGAKADAKSTATDTTPISAMSVWKQISASVQAIATAIAGTLTVATHAVTQSGTWTVQPGNTANTTAWKVDGSAVTQPVSTPYTAAITMTHTTATATTSTGAMLASNGSRKYALLVNDGSVDVYLKLNASAVANAGIRLAANGGSYEMSAAFGNLDTRAVNGITASGSAVVLVTEG